MPPQAEMIISKSNIVYFHDLENDYYTLEHPLTQRYLKVCILFFDASSRSSLNISLIKYWDGDD